MDNTINTDFDQLDFIIEQWPEGIEDRAIREKTPCEYQVLVMTPDHFEIFREHRCTEFVGHTDDELTTFRGEDGVTVTVLAAYFIRRLDQMVEIVEQMKALEPSHVVLVAHKPLS